MNLFKRMFTWLAVAAALFGSGLAVAQGSFNQADITAFNNGEPNGKQSRDHGYKHGVAKCVFDPTAVTGERTVAAHGCGLVIPAKAYVTKAYYKVITTFTSADDSATIAISVAGANDIVSAVAISNGGNPWDAGGLVVGIPTGALSNEVAVSAASEVTFTVGTQALTGGKLVLWVEWVYYGDV